MVPGDKSLGRWKVFRMIGWEEPIIQEEARVKKFVLMHYGFEKPTREIMDAWGEWFGSIQDSTIENLGFRGGREISKDGSRDLPMGPDSITGISIIRAESLDDAEKMARSNPFISSIRVYEVVSQ